MRRQRLRSASDESPEARKPFERGADAATVFEVHDDRVGARFDAECMRLTTDGSVIPSLHEHRAMLRRKLADAPASGGKRPRSITDSDLSRWVRACRRSCAARVRSLVVRTASYRRSPRGFEHNRISEMAKRGDGYGSEDHLLRYWSEQRTALEASIAAAVSWPEGPPDWIYPTNAPTREPEGLSFLSDRSDIVDRWKEFWPQTGTQQCWDGLARLAVNLGTEWVLIEAKANHAEFCTPPCGAAKHGGRGQIERALNATKRHLGVHRDFCWLGSFYQHANRLATLHFLSTQGVRAHLIDVLLSAIRFRIGGDALGMRATGASCCERGN